MYRFLIVDDEAVERQVIRFLLKQYQYPFEISEAVNGKEALKLLSEKSYDILFTDIQMPFLNGISLANHARELYPDIHIIFFSGYDDFAYAKEALSLHVANYILKPINPDEFKDTISDALTQLQNREQLLEEQKAADELTRNHIFYQLINRTGIEQLESQYSQLDLSFARACHRLFLIQLEKDFFFPPELSDVLPKDSYLVNLNPAQNMLLFAGSRHHLSWYQELADRLTAHIRNHPDPASGMLLLSRDSDIAH